MVFVYSKNADGEFICKDCTFKTHNQSTMHYHLKNHDGDNKYECEDCMMTFLQKSVLNLHIQAHHSEEKQHEFECPCCGYSDLRKGNCRIHFARIHLKDLTNNMKGKPTLDNTIVKCNECDKSFKSMSMYYYHVSSCIRLSEDHPLAEKWASLL